MKLDYTLRIFLLVALALRPAVVMQAQSLVADATSTSAADGTRGPDLNGSPALTGARHPLYRLRKSDVVQVDFTFSPEFNQTLTILPDGFVELKDIGGLTAEGLTISELRDAVRSAYAGILRDPEVSVSLKEFEHPFFVAAGQVAHPGKYELRSSTMATEAIAIAGGFTDQSKHSQVVLFRRVSEGVVETHVLNLKTMLASRNLEEDLEIKPGDMLFVPQNRISKIRKFLPVASLSTFFTPAQF
jgi:polysaccharide export outer membrane protein